MRHRKSHKKAHRHYRRVGAALNPGSPVVKLAAVGLGYFLASTINPAIDSVVTKIMPTPATPSTTPATGFGMNANTVAMAGELGLGGFLLMSKKKPSLIKAGLGGILAGAGLNRALKAAGIISGYQAVPVIGRRVHGYQSVPVIGGVPPQLAGIPGTPGMPGQLQGFRVNGYQPTGSGVGVMGKINGLYSGTGIYGDASGSGLTNDSGSEMMN
jgi:hypothetical protein